MPPWLSDLLEKSSAFIPHGHCYLWIPSLLWLHVVSDTLIGLAYIGISLVLYIFVRKVRLPFSPIFVAFGLFIGLCGLTHFMDVWTVWNPDYWLDGLVKAATALASVATAVGLWYVKPQVEEVVHAARLSEERRAQLETKNAELVELYQKVKELDELKTQFFANVSHELRTPLALIVGPVERLKADASLTVEHRRQLDSISRNGKSLLKQVNDLLDVAQLEEGKLRIRYAHLDLVPWFRRLASQFEVTAENRRIEYQVALPERLAVDVDPDMLERVLINLLSNAFKFTPPDGQIRFELREEPGTFSFSVSDTGPGISSDQQAAIFERFRQVNGGSTRQHGGSGLGLAIAKDLVDLHRGDIQVDSLPGQGTTFTVTIPRAAPDGVVVTDTPHSLGPATEAALEGAIHELGRPISDADTIAEPVDPSRPSVLVVEDTAEMRQFIISVLREDYTVIAATDGQDGLQKALAMQPDLIVTDVMMPRMSGDQLVAELRARQGFDVVPILLLTAKADDELRVRLLENGAQDYLTKPFLPQELRARTANLIDMKRAGDALRQEVASASTNLEVLASELASKHRQLQTALDTTEVAREQAERASQVKSHFLAMISHELRTPLSTINMNAQLLSRRMTAASGAVVQLDRLMRASRQLSTLIEGLLEYTRVESGKMAAHVEPVDAAALAHDVLEEAKMQVTSPDVKLVFAPPEGESTLRTDPRLLRVVLNNLISNALKFTKKGTITLRLKQQASRHVFEVQDTGIGIPDEDMHRIFLPFEQVEPVPRKSIPGVGLGLALTKEIVEALGGKVSVTSQPGAGTCFSICLSGD